MAIFSCRIIENAANEKKGLKNISDPYTFLAVVSGWQFQLLHVRCSLCSSQNDESMN